MYFDFDDRYEHVEAVGSAISRREGIVLSVVVHVAIVLAMLFAPPLTFFERDPDQARAEPPPRERSEGPRFVIVEPLRDVPAPAPPPKADLSDMDRQAAAPQIAERPENALPFAQGNSAEPVEVAPEERPRGTGPAPEPAPPAPAPPRTAENAVPLPEIDTAEAAPGRAEAEPTPTPPARTPGGRLGEALRDLQKYVEQEAFNNPTGGVNEFGPAIQFDTRGVEFGPWIRRFVAQVKRNWIVPNSAIAMRGRVIIQFNVHKDGSITDLNIVRPSEIDSFNRSALNALMMSNPTTPLPPEYPEDRAFFTVTFFFNESPAQ